MKDNTSRTQSHARLNYAEAQLILCKVTTFFSYGDVLFSSKDVAFFSILPFCGKSDILVELFWLFHSSISRSFAAFFNTSKMKRNVLFFSLWLVVSVSGWSQPNIPMRLSLDSCRAFAIQNNKSVLMAREGIREATWEHRAAESKLLPRVSASGTYMRTNREISLLSDAQKTMLGSGALLGDMGAVLVDALHTDTRDLTATTVMLTQPLYMGGKILAYNRITHFAEDIARQKHNLALQDVIVEVDETYWRLVHLQERRQLAESYLQLVQKLDADVEAMVTEGVTTRADELSVKVKVNEAEVTLIQLDNGISILQMKLCQVCGLPMDTDIKPLDNSGEPLMEAETPKIPQATLLNRNPFDHRPELQMLKLSTRIHDQKITAARAEYLPQVVLTGGWMGTNPSMFNGFERKLKGMWNVGVMVNIPLVTSGERIFKVNAAKARRSIARLQLSEAREQVELQVNQCQQKLSEARERLTAARASQASADENLRHATLGHSEGVIPVSNVLEAQTAWLSAHSQVVGAEIDLRLAKLYLKKAMGTLSTASE